MTIKEISVENRVQTASQKEKNLNQTVFLNTVFQSGQYCASSLFRVTESRNSLRLKTQTAKKTPPVLTNCIGLPRPFY